MSSTTKTNIAFILPTFVAGGAERVISFIAQNIDSEKFDSRLVITSHKKDAAYSIEGIDVTFLEKKRVFNAVFKLFKFLTTEKPDVVISSIGHLNTVLGLMAPLFPKTKFIVREASVVSAMSGVHKSKKAVSLSSKIRSKLARTSYKFVDHIICQSQDMADDFANVYNVSTEKISIINNPITRIFPLQKTKLSSNDKVKFITIGRLSKEKGHLRILKLLSKLKFDFNYTIIGEGPLKEEIFDAIHTNNLTEKITYIPFTKDVSTYLSSSDLFLQGSYVEGFPNTVIESCFVGTPVLAFNVPGGTKEIINHKENGYLVDTEEDYEYYLNNRLDLSPKDIRDSVVQRFSADKIIKQYETLFNK